MYCIWLIYLVLFQVHRGHKCKFNKRKQVRLIADRVCCFWCGDKLCSLCCLLFFKHSLMECVRSATCAAAHMCEVRDKCALIKLILDCISLQSHLKKDMISAYLSDQIITEIPNSFIPALVCCCCSKVPNPTWSFLQCAGLPPTDAGRDHIHRLKQILEAAMDVYTFMVLE